MPAEPNAYARKPDEPPTRRSHTGPFGLRAGEAPPQSVHGILRGAEPAARPSANRPSAPANRPSTPANRRSGSARGPQRLGQRAAGLGRNPGSLSVKGNAVRTRSGSMELGPARRRPRAVPSAAPFPQP